MNCVYIVKPFVIMAMEVRMTMMVVEMIRPRVSIAIKAARIGRWQPFQPHTHY